MFTKVLTNNLRKEVELPVYNSKDVSRKIMVKSVVTNNLRKEVEPSVDNSKDVSRKISFKSVVTKILVKYSNFLWIIQKM